ncbi:MAG: ECF transporter S component [Actinomycetales bacterium]|nr:ECF transporter S component [Actinomycetales bacterium]
MTSAVRLGRASWIAIGLVTANGLIAFLWPLIAAPESTAVAHASDAPILFAVVVPLLLLVVLAQVSDGGMDAKSIAMLGVLSAVIAALRPLGAGTAGLEPIWIVLILGGRALGPGFGFSLGAVSMFASALLTGGVGPWLPFQMLGAAWVGLGAGLLPPWRGRRELVLLAGYGALASIAYGFLLNLWFWPFTSGLPDAISFTPGAGIGENLAAWLRFCTVTSLGYDIPRAILTVTLILIAGRPVLLALRRVARRAAFDAPTTFVAGTGDPGSAVRPAEAR